MASKTKEVQCIACTKKITVSLFMSAAKAKCDECKSGKAPEVAEDGSFVQKDAPRIEGMPNQALRRLGCPYHPQVPMSVIGVVKGGWGDIITFQCREPECYLLVKISEQQTGPVKTHASGIGYKPDDLINRWPRYNPEEVMNDEQHEGV